ncbi:uncharacterized protein BXZ73DRAFT_76029 [Epithele typhae]|uniref:uncharacterized protein n=1 Tax=Epithele typhae TaxID=378194 RepID=UPI002007A2C1|nr:uncharacterized protein BXZ73DRAFT_76029 [Epithele typhae]KAH9939315.1 hypothetical protein BXZ73DRAFT_76029 [Epithele typhae]
MPHREADQTRWTTCASNLVLIRPRMRGSTTPHRAQQPQTKRLHIQHLPRQAVQTFNFKWRVNEPILNVPGLDVQLGSLHHSIGDDIVKVTSVNQDMVRWSERPKSDRKVKWGSVRPM